MFAFSFNNSVVEFWAASTSESAFAILIYESFDSFCTTVICFSSSSYLLPNCSLSFANSSFISKIFFEFVSVIVFI